MSQDTRIVFTGGGSGGHVFPGLALIPHLITKLGLIKPGEGDNEQLQSFLWLGSYAGPEKQLVESYGISFIAVNTGKLRRYVSFRNIVDIYNLLSGYVQARRILREQKCQLVVSIGGFASVTTVLAAASLNIPIINISCDFSLGLAAKIAVPFSSVILVSYPETATAILSNPLYQRIFLITKKRRQRVYNTFVNTESVSRLLGNFFDMTSLVHCVGNPIRDGVFSGNAEVIAKKYSIRQDKILILFLGGSNGAVQINDIVSETLPSFTERTCLVHQTGINTSHGEEQRSDYKCSYYCFDFITDDFPHFLARADIVVARAGASTVWEIIANEIPSLLIPLSKKSSRGDQIENAEYFASKGMVINLGDNPSPQRVFDAIIELLANSDMKTQLKHECRKFRAKESSKRIADIVDVFLNTGS